VAVWQTRPLLRACILSRKKQQSERIRQVDDSIEAATAIQHCPFCEVYEHTGHNVCCLYCRGFLSEGLLKALRRLPDLPGILPSSSPGTHAKGAGIGRIDATSSFSASQSRVSVDDADSRVYGVAQSVVLAIVSSN
jgi:hypothetical protein